MNTEKRKRILFLDDDDCRHAIWAKQMGARNELVHVHTIDEFAQAIAEEKFDLVYLDHDLNDYPEYSSLIEGADYKNRRNYLTGRHAARLLTFLEPHMRPNHVHIHSWNERGAEAMASILETAGFKVSVKEFPVEVYFREAWARRKRGIRNLILDHYEAKYKYGRYSTYYVD